MPPRGSRRLRKPPPCGRRPCPHPERGCALAARSGRQRVELSIGQRRLQRRLKKHVQDFGVVEHGSSRVRERSSSDARIFTDCKQSDRRTACSKAAPTLEIGGHRLLGFADFDAANSRTLLMCRSSTAATYAQFRRGRDATSCRNSSSRDFVSVQRGPVPISTTRSPARAASRRPPIRRSKDCTAAGFIVMPVPGARQDGAITSRACGRWTRSWEKTAPSISATIAPQRRCSSISGHRRRAPRQSRHELDADRTRGAG